MMNPMLFLPGTLPTLAENLALDEALLLEAESSPVGEVLRLWEWPAPAVVLGAGCRLTEDVNEPACLRDQVPILRRASGGGTVLLGKGCLLFSLILAYDRSPALREISTSYGYILQHLANTLREIIPDVELNGTSDLASNGRKFSGNAQQRKRNYLLHHGTLLYAFKLDQVASYLHLPTRQPVYRQGRDHAAFLMNLPIRVEDLQQRICNVWKADSEKPSWPEERACKLAAEKYTNPAWIRRR
jgi:lipoate-protein ligase A